MLFSRFAFFAFETPVSEIVFGKLFFSTRLFFPDQVQCQQFAIIHFRIQLFVKQFFNSF